MAVVLAMFDKLVEPGLVLEDVGLYSYW